MLHRGEVSDDSNFVFAVEERGLGVLRVYEGQFLRKDARQQLLLMQLNVERVRNVLKVVQDGVRVEMMVMDTANMPSQSLAHAKTTLLEDEDVQFFDF